MCLGMHLVGRFGTWRLDQAIDPARRLVKPIAHVTDAVFGANLDISLVSGCKCVRGQARDVSVCVEICRHLLSLQWRQSEMRRRPTALSAYPENGVKHLSPFSRCSGGR